MFGPITVTGPITVYGPDHSEQLRRIECLLRELLNAHGGMTAEDVEYVVARLTAASDKLDALSK